MATSQNGWPVLLTAPPSVTVPGTGVKVRIRPGDVATVLLWVAQRFDDLVEDLDTAGHPFDPAPKVAGGGPSSEPDDWGWAVRPIRGQATGYSNHSSGTAIDLNASQHPRGVHGTFTAAQQVAMARIVDDPVLDGVVRWGERYSSTVDGMHIEINAGERAVALAAERIRNATKTPEADMSLSEQQVRSIFRDEIEAALVRDHTAPRVFLSPAAAAFAEKLWPGITRRGGLPPDYLDELVFAAVLQDKDDAQIAQLRTVLEQLVAQHQPTDPAQPAAG